jgi:hypothetical protein
VSLTREDVLDVLETVIPLKRRKLGRADVAVHFLKNRIAVVLPEEAFAADERIRLDGKFQNAMTVRKHAHAYLDFAPPGQWKGQGTTLKGGFR